MEERNLSHSEEVAGVIKGGGVEWRRVVHGWEGEG